MPALATTCSRRAAAAALTLGALAAGALAGPAPASAALELDGRGFGHGVGMSQYGAYGFAVRENLSYDSILRHYYTGTEITEVDARRIDVLLKRSSSQKVCKATRASARGDEKRVTLSRDRCYRFSPAGQVSVAVVDQSTNRRVATLRAPVRATGGSRTALRGTAENGLSNGEYRGALELHRAQGGLHAINDVHSRHYLYGVVPAEVPTSWPIEAVKAQAVAARSYAFTSLRPGQPFDVFADTRSQVYRGFTGEDARGRQAVQETGGKVVTHQGRIAQTFFFSTSGGRTSANENGFGGGTPLPYLRPVDDPHDDLSPVHRWTVRFSNAEAGQRLGVGTLESLRVTQRDSDDRARSVEVRGRGGSKTLSGAQVRAKLGLRSAWFSVR
ncbi:MAG TPA: SpoIID/LytB domain-containing protein [Solirubrobacteraceae bacterium]|nr:SpoIID/LytB domain-containing protein [Solirubrobacteraceae bacterium]